MPQTKIERTPERYRPGIGGFLLFVGQRFWHDNCLQMAAALSYSTLFALVPLVAVSIALLSVLPAFDDIRAQLLLDLYSEVLPTAQVEISRQFSELVRNAENLTAFGLLGLVVMVLLLYSAVSQNMDGIWRVPSSRSIARHAFVFVTILAMPLLLLGISLILSGSLELATKESKVAEVAAQLPGLPYAQPLVLQAIGFTIFYYAVPNAHVWWRDAATGGLIAALLFEALKLGFGLYIDTMSNYQTIYGALSAIPILLVWLYAMWTILIIGAEVAASLGDHRRLRDQARSSENR